MEKLEKSIKLLEEYIRDLEPSSIEYRTEKDDLHKLMEYHKHLKGKINVNVLMNITKH